MMAKQSDSERFLRIAEEVARYAGKVRFMAVTKTRTPETVNAAIEAGFTLIGENRAQELIARQPFYLPCETHFIGALQTNKVRQIIGLVDMIESVDSLRLATEIDRRAGEAGRVMPVLLEINIAREPQKSGVMPEEAEALLRAAAALPHLSIRGLMTIGAADADNETRRSCFRSMFVLRERLAAIHIANTDLRELSMGMSRDYPLAIEAGATIVRLGTALFGDRL